MPLSDHEQQLLDQMEQALYAEDPRFATQMKGVARRGAHKRHILGGLGVLVGLALVLVGVNTTWIIGGIGFALMVASLAYALSPGRPAKVTLGSVPADGSIRSTTAAGGAKKSRPRKPAASSGTFLQRLEARWERRRGGG